jgi:hypothetical protein
MRKLLLGTLALLLAGCGAYSFPGSTPPTASTGVVTGRVLAFPCAPVEQPQDVCAGRPLAGLELDYTGGACAPCKAVTNSNGEYSADLNPGTYKVRLATYMHVISGPVEVTVSPGSTVTANYLLDSGIRAPAPQQ